MSTKKRPVISRQVLDAMRALLTYPDMGCSEISALLGVEDFVVLRAARMLYRAQGMRMLADEVRRLREEVQSMRRVIDGIREDPLLRSTREEIARRAIKAMGNAMTLRRLMNKVKAQSSGDRKV